MRLGYGVCAYDCPSLKRTKQNTWWKLMAGRWDLLLGAKCLKMGGVGRWSGFLLGQKAKTFLFCLEGVDWHGIGSVGPTFAIGMLSLMREYLPSWGSFDKIRNGKLHYNIFSLSSIAHDTADTHKSCFEHLLLTVHVYKHFSLPIFSLLLLNFPVSHKSNLEVWQLIKVSTDLSSGVNYCGWFRDPAHSSGGLSLIYHYQRLWHIPGWFSRQISETSRVWILTKKKIIHIA